MELIMEESTKPEVIDPSGWNKDNPTRTAIVRFIKSPDVVAIVDPSGGMVIRNRAGVEVDCPGVRCGCTITGDEPPILVALNMGQSVEVICDRCAQRVAVSASKVDQIVRKRGRILVSP